ncbi:MAG: hypothetical protein J6K57_02115 [Alistipes sp.]|nr:hypothetical protein [Alistipes sp.]
MRKYIALLFAALALCSCDKPDNNQSDMLIEVTPTTLAGLWMLESYDNGKRLAEGTFVYIDFVRSDRSYTIYQNVGSMYTQTITGNYFIDIDSELGAVIRGNYGTDEYNYFDWSHRYIVQMQSDTMRWIAKDDPENISVYIRVDALPEGIVEE